MAALAIIVASICLQTVAAILALRLIRMTGWWTAWTAIATALLIMAGRRALSLVHAQLGEVPIDPLPEMMALAISVLMVAGVHGIGIQLRSWSESRRRDGILRQAQEMFIGATGAEDGRAFAALCDGLARHLRWDGIAIGLIEDDGSPVGLGSGGAAFAEGRLPASQALSAGVAALTANGFGGVAKTRVGTSGPDGALSALAVLSGGKAIGLMTFVGRDRALPDDVVLLAVTTMIGSVLWQRQRREAARSQQRLIVELERTNTELEQFAYISSHDMQEPLRMVILYLELLQRRYGDLLGREGTEYLGFAVEGARRMHDMILDLLEYSRLGRSDEAKAQGTDAMAAFDEARRAVAASPASITVAHPLPRVAAHRNDLYRIFLNLLSNAVKFAHRDRPPVVQVGAEREGGWWHFQVADNGIGIDPAYYDKIFQVFQRLHSREEYKGTGIGLAFVKKAVELYGGRVWVESRPGAGTTFHFTLPAEKDAGGAPGETSNALARIH